jgi:hypothetical protein
MNTEESNENQLTSSEELKTLILMAVEFGFRQCEVGANLQAAKEAAKSFFEEIGG